MHTYTHTLATIQRRTKVNLSENFTKKKKQKNLHVLVLVINFSIDDVVSEIKTLYCKPNIRHLPAAVYEFGPVEAFFYLSFTNNQLSSLLSISPSSFFCCLTFPLLLVLLPLHQQINSALQFHNALSSVHYQTARKTIAPH